MGVSWRVEGVGLFLLFLLFFSFPEAAIYTNLQVCLNNCDYMSIYEAMQKIGKLMFIFQIQRLS